MGGMKQWFHPAFLLFFSVFLYDNSDIYCRNPAVCPVVDSSLQTDSDRIECQTYRGSFENRKEESSVKESRGKPKIGALK